MIRVLLADDHEVIRYGLERLVSAQPDMEIAGMAVDGCEAVLMAELGHPDVILMDLEMPCLDGVEATREIMLSNPEARVLVLTSYAQPATIRDAFAAGAWGYLFKDTAPADLLEDVRAVYRGERPMATAVRSVLGL